MLPLLSALIIAQAPAKPPAKPPVPAKPEVVVSPQPVRPLPGGLDKVLVFNSNSPEVVQTEGILLSTFPSAGKASPAAHLNRSLAGRFDVFAHHIAKATSPENLKTLYLGILLQNPGNKTVTVDVLQAASYLSQPDAPFIKLPTFQENPQGAIYAGPGDRATNDVLRNQRQPNWPAQIKIPPGESRLLLNQPIPVRKLEPPINGRSTLARLRATGPVYVASLARFAPTDAKGQERAPTRQEWEHLLQSGQLAGPRDKTPTPPGAPGKLIYGRVAGVAKGSVWQARVSDPGKTQLQIPAVGQAFSYALSTVARGSFGTGQVQSAPMVVRYPDTAYAAHGNYGIQYQLSLPLYNPTDKIQTVTVALQTPLKRDEAMDNLQFFKVPSKRVFFRGTVQVRYKDDQGRSRSRYFHLVQHRGERGTPLVTLNLAAKQTRRVQVDFLYPPDATPPQVLTVTTLAK